MSEEFLSGKDSTILAIIAQRPNMAARDRDKLLGQLEGVALQIAKALTGLNKRPSKKIRDACEQYKLWAQECKEHHANNRSERPSS